MENKELLEFLNLCSKELLEIGIDLLDDKENTYATRILKLARCMNQKANCPQSVTVLKLDEE